MENQSLSHVEASPNNTKPSTVLVNQAALIRISLTTSR
jgi:hypothetical protein